MNKKYILWFSEVNKDDIATVGGKGANLGEMVQAGFPVPDGFIVTASAYFEFLEETKIKKRLKELLANVNVDDSLALDRISRQAKKTIIRTSVPQVLANQIMMAYLDLTKREAKTKKYGLVKKIKASLRQPLVAVRSSATAEDLPAASFAGQQATFLNVKGEANVVEMVKRCWASLFEARAIFYRVQQSFDHFQIGIAVPVEKMVQADTAGVLFTVDPVTGDKKTIIIEAIYGLGEYIVQGTITPDHYKVDKRTLHITEKVISLQKEKLIFKQGKTTGVSVSADSGERQKISDREILSLAKLGKKIERHYFFPQDVEWAIEDGEIYIVQTRPVTTLKAPAEKKITTLASLSKKKILLQGNPASPGIARGAVRLVKSAKEVHKVRSGEVLVAPQTNPDYVPAMRKAVAIVTERGGRTSHAAIVSRELGIPAVVGAADAMKKLKQGSIVTVEGTTGNIYQGGVDHATIALQRNLASESAGRSLKTATKLYVNLAEPDRAREVAKRNVDGVGLLRAEFMVANIGYHPRKLIKEGKKQRFVTMLTDQLEVFCQAFFPRPVVYRATDFKTNEYRNLKGGQLYEPEEPNPMLGFRGAARYIADPEVFMLELEAVKRIRDKKKLHNLWLMIPFVRTAAELTQVKRIAAASGLNRSATFKLWMMVELPSNVILLDDFVDVGIDGVSIGSNDLTMLIMGTDRDNSEVAQVFDERNAAVQWAIKHVINICHKRNITSSICGQAPSDYPEMVESLVKWGVSSISVNPDAIERTRETVYAIEKKQVSKR